MKRRTIAAKAAAAATACGREPGPSFTGDDLHLVLNMARWIAVSLGKVREGMYARVRVCVCVLLCHAEAVTMLILPRCVRESVLRSFEVHIQLLIRRWWWVYVI